tara:strand:- start:1124 stop:1366 length:243 start_codon:yes stop_codon:yes gene_type:complete
MGESYTPRKKSKKYNWKKHLKSNKTVHQHDFSGNTGPWVVLDYHSRDENNQTVYIDKHGKTHTHKSLQYLTDKGYRLHFK